MTLNGFAAQNSRFMDSCR